MYKPRLFCALGAMLISPLVHATVDAWVENIRHYRDFKDFDGLVNTASIPRESETEKILLKTQKRLDRLLDDREIQSALPGLLDEFNESLIYALDLPSESRYRPGLGGLTEILMADRTLKLLKNIRPGDLVMSINMATGSATSNLVREVQVNIHNNWSEFGVAKNQAAPLRASPDFLILVEWSRRPRPRYIGVFRAKFATEDREVFKFHHDNPRKDLILEPFGREIRRSGWFDFSKHYSITLAHEPRTYVANTLVLPDTTFCESALEAYHKDHPYDL